MTPQMRRCCASAFSSYRLPPLDDHVRQARPGREGSLPMTRSAMESSLTAGSARPSSTRATSRWRLMSRILILAGILVVPGGCVTKLIGFQRMWKVGATTEDYKRDDYVCSQETQGYLFSFMWRDCM